MNKLMMSKERKDYLKDSRKKKITILITQILIIIGFLALWEILARFNIIDSFIMSQPSRIWDTFMNLSSNDLLTHIGVTVYETLIGFLLGAFLGVIIAIILWWSNFLARVSEPFLVVLNSLPKVALRTSYNNMGWSRYSSNYYNGSDDFFNCNSIGKFKWIFKYR